MIHEDGKSIALSLPYPISANRYWASRVIKCGNRYQPVLYVTNEAKAYRDQVRLEALRVGIRKPLQGRIEMACYLYPQQPKDWKRRQFKDPELWEDTVRCIDLGNCEKVMSDALQGIVIEDDKAAWSITLCRMPCDDKGARLEVHVSPYRAWRIE